MRTYWSSTLQKLLTRNNKEVIIPDSWQESLRHIDLNLDGELIAIDAENQFQRTMQIARRTTNPDFDAWEQELVFCVFDIVDETDRPFSERYAMLRKLYGDGSHPHPFIRLVEQTPIGESTDLNALLEEAVANGEEGVIVKDNTRPYAFRRSTGCLKLKKFQDSEAVVVGLERGKGRNANRLGQILCETPEKARFRIGTGFSDFERQNPPCKVGDIVTYRYFTKSKTGIPRFPTWVGVRTDVDPKELGFVS